mmetsp:Transcript_82633/g.130215  ORF Transcript_82633/g.130215 Transcript_82633/m.130215 type:complete len:283 (-) Transcript_82633:125-973(-)
MRTSFLVLAALVVAAKGIGNASNISISTDKDLDADEDEYGDEDDYDDPPGRLMAWGVLSGRFPNFSHPSGTSISCYGTRFFAHEVSLGFPLNEKCIIIIGHISDFDGGCSSDEIFTPAHAPNRTKIGTLGPVDTQHDMRLLLLDPPIKIPFFFHMKNDCVVTQEEPIRLRKYGASTGATDVRVAFAFLAQNVRYYSGTRRQYTIDRAWFARAPGFATPDDSGSFVEGLVKIDGTRKWCRMGMLLGGGGDDNSFVVVLPVSTMMEFARSHSEICGSHSDLAEL